MPHLARFAPAYGQLKSLSFTFLLAVVAIRGSEYGIEPELIGTNAILTDFILNPGKLSNPLRQGWRKEIAGRDLMEILQGQIVGCAA